MKGFEVLGYPLWNHIHHGFNNPDSYVKYAYGNFNNGCMDCDGSEDYVVFQTNTAKFMTNLAAYIEKMEERAVEKLEKQSAYAKQRRQVLSEVDERNATLKPREYNLKGDEQ